MSEIVGANLQWQDNSGEWLDIVPIDISPPKISETRRDAFAPFSMTIATTFDYDVWELAARQAAAGGMDAGHDRDNYIAASFVLD